jgi:hypothetical protein
MDPVSKRLIDAGPAPAAALDLVAFGHFAQVLGET